MFRTSRGRPGRHTLLITPLLSLLLASCGGGGDASSASGSSSASNGEATTAVSTDVGNSNAGTSTGIAPIAANPAAAVPILAAAAKAPSTGSPASSSAGGTNAGNGASGPAAPVTTSPATTTTTTTPATGQVIEYYGDSTIWGYSSGSGARVAMPAPAAFAAALPAARNYSVINEGVNGSTACQLLNGTDGRHPAWDTQMASSKASIVILNHAINDEWKEDLATYRGCLSSLSQKARQHGKKIVFETPNPTRDSGVNGLDVYVNAMKAVATQENAPVIDQYKYLTGYLNGQSAYTICPDGLHPTDAVYILKGKYAAGAFALMGL
ncbi:MAG: hydrolase family protein [Herminiimonas sp.]|nr:hydrolase family protein [Herminiimonas sp.]